MQSTCAAPLLQSPSLFVPDSSPYFGDYPLVRDGARALDPSEAQFKQAVPGGEIDESRRRYYRGMYKEQYRLASHDGIWGQYGCRGCGRAVLVRYRLGSLMVMPRLCCSWACRLCGVRRAAWLKDQLRKAQRAYHLDFFWTLTIRVGAHASRMAIEASHALVRKAWNILRTSLVHDFGKFSFCWVAESTERGAGHEHLLVSLDLAAMAPADAAVRRRHIDACLDGRLAAVLDSSPASWALAELSRRWRLASDGSFIVDVQPVESARACDYLAKYCTQQATNRPRALRKKRVFSRSRDVAFEPFRRPSEHPEEWQVWGEQYWSAVRKLQASGAELVGGRGEGAPYAEFRDTEGLHPAGVPARLCVGWRDGGGEAVSVAGAAG